MVLAIRAEENTGIALVKNIVVAAHLSMPCCEHDSL